MKINLTLDRRNPARNRVVVDGHDIGRYIPADGLHVDTSQPGEPRVTITLRPDLLEIDGEVALVIAAARTEGDVCGDCRGTGCSHPEPLRSDDA